MMPEELLNAPVADHSGDHQSNGDTKQKPVVIDLSDMDLAGDDLAIDNDADAFGGPPPPPEGIRYFVKLAHQPGEGGVTSEYKKGTTKRGEGYVMTRIVATIQDPGGRFDNTKLFDNPMTLVMDSGTCRMAGILKVLRTPAPARTNNVALARLFREAINGEPQTFVEVQWGAYLAEDKKTVGKGMKRWPKKEDGSHHHVAIWDGTKLWSESEARQAGVVGFKVEARAEIAAYFNSAD